MSNTTGSDNALSRAPNGAEALDYNSETRARSAPPSPRLRRRVSSSRPKITRRHSSPAVLGPGKNAQVKLFLDLDKKNLAWKEIIDGRHHKFGKDVYDKGLHYPNDWKKLGYDSKEEAMADYSQKGYIASAMKARAFVAKHIGDPVTAAFLGKVHAASAKHIESDEDFHQGYRTDKDSESHVPFYAGSEYPKGNAPMNALGEINTAFTALKTDDAGDDVEVAPKDMPAFTKNADNLILHFLPRTRKQLMNEVDRILNDFYSEIAKKKSDAGQLDTIASTHRKLENLHPFLDANTRTNRLILHKLLVEYGMTPVILENPLDVHLKTDAEWAAILRDGMDQWAIAAK